MDIRDELKLPDVGMTAYYAGVWRDSGKDLLNLKKYLMAKYVEASEDVNSDHIKGFKDGIAALYAHMESCLRLQEDQDSPKTSKSA